MTKKRTLEDWYEECLADENDHDDDRYDRWMTVNGITQIGWRKFSDGHVQIVHLRADGTEVDAKNSYPYDAKLTPYTRNAGSA